MRMSNGAGVLEATYGYDEFGQDILNGVNTLKNALGKIADLVNPFGFVGYQRDNIADDYFAEAREYRPEEGRFSGTDKVRGFIEMPFTLNRYGYCYNNGMLMNDLNGMWPNPIKWVKDKTKKAAKAVGKFYEKHRDAVNIVGGAAIIAAGAAFAPVIGVSAAAVAISGTTAAVIGGVSNMTTGGRFSDGFLGGAVNGTIAAFIGGAGGQFVGGFVGTEITEHVSGGRTEREMLMDSLCAGGAQAGLEKFVNPVFDRAKECGIGKTAECICEAYKDIYSYTCGTMSSILSNYFFDEKSKEKVGTVECN
ncbi:RHS repeat-associated core domain-containing protein [Lachnobacterium bovis DSM 14045]|uniref:RHS repeat-associated core domain-containing protein n=2 Tax=Lachnobacterium bovis TaxID=140626 RepID=A0A1H3FXD6_9FIRM|nr:RHS repeat-associated core domain-containing protein [Lachnobacterium bovis DSM 14045]